jgi:plasmid stabilization system protein ParE
MARVIVWNKRPSKFLTQALKRISEDSLIQAERVEDAILTSIKGLIAHPEKYPPDKFKKNNAGDYRAFEKLSFRIAYKFTAKQIRILRIRYVRQEPKDY